jgi:hypothetical protein
VEVGRAVIFPRVGFSADYWRGGPIASMLIARTRATGAAEQPLQFLLPATLASRRSSDE